MLDIDDDFRAHTLPHTHTTNNTAFIRVPHGGHSVDDSHLVHTCMSSCTRELNLILKEIRMITDKMRKKDEDDEVSCRMSPVEFCPNESVQQYDRGR